MDVWDNLLAPRRKSTGSALTESSAPHAIAKRNPCHVFVVWSAAAKKIFGPFENRGIVHSIPLSPIWCIALNQCKRG